VAASHERGFSSSADLKYHEQDFTISVHIVQLADEYMNDYLHEKRRCLKLKSTTKKLPLFAPPMQYFLRSHVVTPITFPPFPAMQPSHMSCRASAPLPREPDSKPGRLPTPLVVRTSGGCSASPNSRSPVAHRWNRKGPCCHVGDGAATKMQAVCLDQAWSTGYFALGLKA
jgi:hypothetical protein